ncbi:MAG: calcium-binding protein [Deltaproteobacteria bacterium]|jgi:hypothetical protein|nr:calcium-binding protein [Deltaproteobacteria bacterium]
MARVKENKEREERIEMEIVVDAYNEEERAMGWYYYLENRMRCPLKARCITERRISLLKEGEVVEVVGMAPEEDCEKEMFVEIRWQNRTLGVPLSQLKGIEVDEGTQQAMDDWCYWIDRGYEF